MNINFTLFVQGIHFFIAYFLLDRFLIRRVLGLIHTHELVLENAKKRVVEVEQEIKNKELLKERLWNSFKNFFIQEAPPFAKRVYKEVVPGKLLEAPSLEPAQKERMIKELKEVVVKKVSHVD